MVGAGGVGEWGFAKEVEGTRFHNQGPNEEPSFDFLHVAKCRHSFVPSPIPTLVPTTHSLAHTYTLSLVLHKSLSLSLTLTLSRKSLAISRLYYATFHLL